MDKRGNYITETPDDVVHCSISMFHSLLLASILHAPPFSVCTCLIGTYNETALALIVPGLLTL